MTAIKARWNKNGNIKLGAIWSYSALMGNEGYYIPKLGMVVTGTCGHHCECCKKDCYVKKSYRYDSVKYGHARNTLAMRQDPRQAGKDLSDFITRAKNKPCACRFDQSGEIETADQLAAFCYVADQHKETPFFVYTKAYDIIVPALLAGQVPENLTVLISVWHNVGIRWFNLVKHLPNVKAFVYDDGKFDYAAAGLNITAWCTAYDASGKLDKNITCQKCQKCYNRSEKCRVIGCKAH